MDGDFRIGQWLIQPQLNRMAGSEKTVQVEPKVMEVLVYLARHAGEVLSKERIIQAVWADTFVTDDVLTHAISELRKAFNDDAKNPRIIETISRRGYRLGSEVERVLEPGSQPPAAESAAAQGVKRKLLLGILSAVVLVSLLVFALIRFREASEPRPAMRFSLTPPEGMRVQLFDGPIISPEGRQVAFTGLSESGQRLLWVHALDSLTPQVLAGTEGASLPFWSPDSRFLGFFAQGKLKKIERTGGPVLTLCEASRGRGGTWNREGRILFTPTHRDPLYVISEKGGEIRPVTTLEKARGELSHRYPHFLPDGRHFIYAVEGPSERDRVYLGSLDSESPRPLLRDYSNTIYASGYLLFVREETLMAQAFNPRDLQTTGEALPLEIGFAPVYGFGLFSASESGVLAYRVRDLGGQLVWLDRQGKELGVLGPPAFPRNPALSPDEKRVAVDLWDPQKGKFDDIWLIELSTGVHSRFTFEPSIDHRPIWSPDGSRIVFDSDREQEGQHYLYEKPSSGAGQARLLLQMNSGALDWSRDGRFIFFQTESERGDWDLWVLPLFGDQKPMPYLQTESDECCARFSPDGHWVAYTSNESGRPEVYIQSFPEPRSKWQISNVGGMEPRWRGDGKELFYRHPVGQAGGFPTAHKLMAVEMAAESSVISVGVPKALFDLVFDLVEPANYAVTADGQHFLVVRPLGLDTSPPITVVLNWTAGLEYP